MSLMSYRGYAEHRGCSLRAVQKAVGDPDAKGHRDGRIAAALVSVEGSVHPKIDSEKADALWLLNTDETKRSTMFTPGDGSPRQGAAGTDDDDNESVSDAESDAAKKSYHLSRAARAAIDTENAQLDLELRKGKLIDLDEAKQLGFTALRMLRDALRNTGPRIASQLAAMTDPFECEQLINAEIDAALASLTAEKILATPHADDDLEGEGD